MVRRPFLADIQKKPSDSLNVSPLTPALYNARESEPRWQRQGDEQGIFATRNDEPREEYCVLEMFLRSSDGG